MEEYNIENLNNFLEEDRTPEEVCKWFDRMVTDYNGLKRRDMISDETMYKLFEFWNNIKYVYGNNIYNILDEHWDDKPIKMMSDFHEFAPVFHKKLYEKLLFSMDEIEKEETEALIREVWNKNQRMELSISYYDYDLDIFQELMMVIPRKNRNKLEPEFKTICANIILNRGQLLVKLYCQRGLVEYAAITVDEDGRWLCLNESEVASYYHNENNKPLTMKKNEKVIFFNHPLQSRISDFEKMFNVKYS